MEKREGEVESGSLAATVDSFSRAVTALTEKATGQEGQWSRVPRLPSHFRSSGGRRHHYPRKPAHGLSGPLQPSQCPLHCLPKMTTYVMRPCIGLFFFKFLLANDGACVPIDLRASPAACGSEGAGGATAGYERTGPSNLSEGSDTARGIGMFFSGTSISLFKSSRLTGGI